MGIQTSTVNNGPTAGFKNAIINGNFSFWQRGTSATATLSYAADRWQLVRVGSTCTNSQQTFTVGQTDVPNNPVYWARNVVATVAGAANYVFTTQYIEDVRTFAGQQITISYWAKADAAKPIAIELVQSFGTGGSPSTAVNTFVAKPTLTTSWARYSHTITVPSISGKTLGTGANSSYLAVSFWFDAGSNFNSRTNTLGQQSGTFDIAQVQVEAGPVATAFEQRPVGTELALCQRYYYKVITPATARYGAGHNTVTTGGVYGVVLPVTMRIAPTSIETTGTATDYDIQHANTATTCSAVPTFATASTSLVTVTGLVASGLTVGQGSSLRSTSATSFLAFPAEF